MIGLCQAQGDPRGLAEAQQRLLELELSDPNFAPLDARLASIVGGESPKDNAERLALAQRAYDTQRYAAAARLWGEALELEPTIGDDRQKQHRYNAACAAVLAANTAAPAPIQRNALEGQGRKSDEGGQVTTLSPSLTAAEGQGGRADLPFDDDAKAKLRAQALDWLKAELATWTKLVESAAPEQRAAIAQILQHGQVDADLASVRDADALAKLPEAEQKPWQMLWADVDALLAKAKAQTP